MRKTFVCRIEQCPREGLKAFEAEGGLTLLIASSGCLFYAYQAKCPHMDVPLEEGFYDGSVITCHQQLADILREEIASGRLKGKHRLATEFELMERFSVSRTTVRQTIALLQKEG